MTLPLVTDAEGRKFGKSTGGGNVWLDPTMTSPYAWYQYFINSADADVGKYLRLFTFLDREEIEDLERTTAERPQLRAGQRRLAEELTTLVHGEDQTRKVVAASQALFGRGELAELDEPTLEAAMAEVPTAEVRLADGPTIVDLLVETGGLTGATAMRRLGETQKWAVAVSRPGGMRRFGEGFRLTVHVRAMHALINDRFERNGRWDTARWGLPINQADQAATLGLFNSTLLLGMRGLGWVITPTESRAVMHLWKYVGWLMGVDEDWLFDTEREQNAFNYHVLRVQDGVTAAGAALSGALVDGQLRVHRSAVAGRFARERLLSMLRYFLGAPSIRDLELPVRPVWAVPPIAAVNLVKSGLVSRFRAGRRWLERAGDRYAQADLARAFGGAEQTIGELPG